jgi:hypothetical protein
MSLLGGQAEGHPGVGGLSTVDNSPSRGVRARRYGGRSGGRILLLLIYFLILTVYYNKISKVNCKPKLYVNVEKVRG